MTEIHEADITLPDGSLVHYSTAGSGTDVVVLLHGGLPGSSGAAGWRMLMPALASAGLHVIAPDCPGFGRADTRPEYHPSLGIMSWVDFLQDFTTALGVDRFFLAGNSQGAQVAAHYAVNHFDRLRSIAFVASAGMSKSLGIPDEELAAASFPPPFTRSEASMREVLEHIVRRTEHLTDELIAQRTAAALVQEHAYAAGRRAVLTGFENPDMRQWMQIGNRITQLTVPAIYLHGRQDVLNPIENAYKQEDRLPNVQFFYPDDCGHQGQTDQPEMFAQVLTEFFVQGKVSARTASWAGISERRPPLPAVVPELSRQT
jgi:2-hydroxy-6-oxonona-2,4-dienedioate hydrolase